MIEDTWWCASSASCPHTFLGHLTGTGPCASTRSRGRFAAPQGDFLGESQEATSHFCHGSSHSSPGAWHGWVMGVVLCWDGQSSQVPTGDPGHRDIEPATRVSLPWGSRYLLETLAR